MHDRARQPKYLRRGLSECGITMYAVCSIDLCVDHQKVMKLQGSGYGYGTVPGVRWAIDTEGGHVVVSVSLIRNGYEYGTAPDRRGTIHTESGHVVNSVSQ